MYYLLTIIQLLLYIARNAVEGVNAAVNPKEASARIPLTISQRLFPFPLSNKAPT
jgi:hypothetical protein